MSCRKRKAAGLLLVLFTLFLCTIGSSLGGGSPTVAPPPQSVEKITSVPITDDDISWLEYDKIPVQRAIVSDKKRLLKKSIRVMPWKIVQATSDHVKRIPLDRLLNSAKFTMLLYVSYAGASYFMTSIWPQLLSWRETLVIGRNKIRRIKRRNTSETNISDVADEKKRTETVLEAVSKEQEDIWKALHGMYDTQSEKISLVINSTEATRELMNQLRASVELNLSKLSVRIDDIMVDLNVLTGKYERVVKEVKSIEREDSEGVDSNTLLAVQAEVDKCKKEVASMKRETLDIIKGHDDIVISKLKTYLDEIKVIKKSTKSQK